MAASWHGWWIHALLGLVAHAGSMAEISPWVPENSWVAVIRHGEKDATGHYLSKIGWQRAAYLIELFGSSPATPFASPRAIFANLYGPSMASVELSKPIAKDLGLEVITSYSHGDNQEAADAILGALQQTGGPILVIWEHKNIAPLAADLGCWRDWMQDLAGKRWRRSDYDHMFNLTFGPDGTCVGAELENEGFVPLLAGTSHVSQLEEVLLLLTALVACGILLWCLLSEHLQLRWRTKAGSQLPLLSGAAQSS